MIASDVERLAIEQAVYNAIGADLKTGVADNLRGQVNGFYLDLYRQTGATAFEVRLRGQKVGTYGFSKVRGTPERTEAEVVVTDHDAVMGSDDFREWLDGYVGSRINELAALYAQDTGELLDGMEVVERAIPATPDTIRPNGTLRVRPEKVAAALGNELPATIAGLLGGGAS